MAYRISQELWKDIAHYAAFPQTGVSLQQMIMFGENPSQGTLLKAAQFLVEELPVRLAHRVQELDTLPEGLSEMASIKKVKNWYAQSFEELVNFPPPELSPELRRHLNGHHHRSSSSTSPEGSTPTPQRIFPEATANLSITNMWKHGLTPNGHKRRIPIERRLFASHLSPAITWPPSVYEYNRKFTKCLEAIKRRHDPTATTVAAGVLEWKRAKGLKEPVLAPEIGEWLDRFFLSRIGIRFLIGQHIALNTLPASPDYVGIICKHANVHDTLTEAIDNARYICEEHFGMFKGPPVDLVCPKDLTFPYVPGHLNHIVFELLKNSLRAVVERFGTDPSSRHPPTKVIAIEGQEDITIKISDEGGGIPRSAMPLIWSYMYTTMERPTSPLEDDFGGSDFRAPMAGFGYGLPLARLYARYFGGDLQLISLDGYGTDVYIHLNKLSSSIEPLL